MRRAAPFVLAMAATLVATPTELSSQQPFSVNRGDSVRVWPLAGRRFDGRLVRWTRDSLTVRLFPEDTTVALARLRIIERYHRENPAFRILVFTVVAGGIGYAATVANQDRKSQDWTVTAISAVGGGVIGTILYLLSPGSWDPVWGRPGGRTSTGG